MVFSDDFRGNGSWLIRLNSLNIKNKIWRQPLGIVEDWRLKTKLKKKIYARFFKNLAKILWQLLFLGYLWTTPELTHLFPIHTFSKTWKHQKTV